MKIGSVDAKPVSTPQVGERKAAAPATSATEPSAKVELSSAATLAADGAATADFDQAKVDRIAQAIRDGKYEINPEAIADKLIANASELLAKPSN